MPLAEYVAAVMADSPRAYYKMQEASGLPQDSSGNALHMDVTQGAGHVYQAAGPMGDFCIDFERASTQAFSRGTGISTVVNNFTIETWVKAEQFPGDAGYLLTNGATATDGYGLYISSTSGANKFHLLFFSVADMGASTTALLIETWYLIAAVRRAGTTEYYLNGQLDSTKGTSTPDAPTGRTALAAQHTGAAFSLYHDGELAHTAFYETALTQARLEAHYDAAFEVAIPPASSDHPPMGIHGRGAGW